MDIGPLIVHGLTSNLPNSIHFITNYGLFILDYPFDLTSTE